MAIMPYSSLILFLWYKKSKMNELWLSPGSQLLAYVIDILNYPINTAAVFQTDGLEKHADWGVGGIWSSKFKCVIMSCDRQSSRLIEISGQLTLKQEWVKFLIYAQLWRGKLSWNLKSWEIVLYGMSLTVTCMKLPEG
jgi:hypothetical protein